MKTTDIRVGKTYINRGAGRTRRTVLAIGKKHRPDDWFGVPGSNPDPSEPGVLYEQRGLQNNLYLSSFAAWAGKEAS